MKKLFTLVAAFALIGCGSDGGGGDKKVDADARLEASISGEYAEAFINKTTGDILVITIKVGGGKVDARTYIFPTGNTTTGHYRKSAGTYEVKGGAYHITYSHETCDPVGSEVIEIKRIDRERVSILFPDEGIEYTVRDVESIDEHLSDAGMIVSKEDVDCDKFPTAE